MGVVHEEVAAERAGGVVVDAAGAVGDVGHDEGFCGGAELGQDVGDGGGEEEEAFRHLQSHLFRTRRTDSVDGLVELEVVILWEKGDGLVDGRVVENIIGGVVQGARWAATRRDYVRSAHMSLWEECLGAALCIAPLSSMGAPFCSAFAAAFASACLRPMNLLLASSRSYRHQRRGWRFHDRLPYPPAPQRAGELVYDGGDYSQPSLSD